MKQQYNKLWFIKKKKINETTIHLGKIPKAPTGKNYAS